MFCIPVCVEESGPRPHLPAFPDNSAPCGPILRSPPIPGVPPHAPHSGGNPANSCKPNPQISTQETLVSAVAPLPFAGPPLSEDPPAVDTRPMADKAPAVEYADCSKGCQR